MIGDFDCRFVGERRFLYNRRRMEGEGGQHREFFMHLNFSLSRALPPSAVTPMPRSGDGGGGFAFGFGAQQICSFIYSRRPFFLSFHLHSFFGKCVLGREESEREHASAHFKCTAFPRRVKAKGRPRCPLPYLRFAKRDSKFQSRHESRLFFSSCSRSQLREKKERVIEEYWQFFCHVGNSKDHAAKHSC